MAAIPELKRKTCTYSFYRESLTSLAELSNLVTGCNQKVFDDQYGDILMLLKMVVDPVPLQTLLQFYDPELLWHIQEGHPVLDRDIHQDRILFKSGR